MARFLGQVYTVLTSAVVGAVAGFAFKKQSCVELPGVSGGGFHYGPRQICHDVFNKQIGVTLTLIGWGIAAVWFVLQVVAEQSATRRPPQA